QLWSIVASPIAINTSAGRFSDGADTDTNGNDFLTQAAAALSTASPAGPTKRTAPSVEGFSAGQTTRIDSGANLEDALIATVGGAGATPPRNATDAGATVLPVADLTGFSKGQ